jgi:hypothetical protein
MLRLCKFSIIRVVLNRSIDGGDSNAIVIAVKIQVNIRTKISDYYVFCLIRITKEHFVVVKYHFNKMEH